MKRTLSVAVCALALVPAVFAQDKPSSVKEIKNYYNMVKNNLTKMADKMPDDLYGYQPVGSIRPFGAVIGHVADAHINFCSAMLGEKKQGDAGSKTAKADLVAALKDSFAYCDKAMDAMTDANAQEPVGGGRMQRTRAGMATFLLIHDNEEYGYMSIYLRLKNITPPSSEGR